MKRIITRYILTGLLFLGAFEKSTAQTDTLESDLLTARRASPARTLSMQSMAAVQALATSAPAVSYGSARNFTLNQEFNWSPSSSGGAAEFVVSVEQTLTGYYNPLNTVISSDNSMYTANTGMHSILKRTSGGTQSLFAGGNSTAYGYADGTGSAARFRHPSFVAIDGSGNLFVSDQQNHRIRKITPAGVVSTFAGSGSIGSADGTGTAASFQYPMGLAFDGSGNLYVADAYNHRIRKITPTGVVSTYAGNGTAGLVNGVLLSASFNYPIGLSFDSNGDLYVADRSNFAIRRISGGTVSTVAGNGTTGNIDGTGSAARFQANGLIAEGGNIYFVDQTYHGLKHLSPSGQVVTISSSGQFTGPFGISKGPDGKFYVTENSVDQIKKLSVLPAYSISPALPPGLLFDRYTGRISGKLGQARSSQTYTVTVRNNMGSSTATLTFSVGAVANGPVASTDQNYILTRSPRRAYTSTVALGQKSVDSVNVSIQYFDGLGRPSQSSQWQGSPLKNDIVQYIEYDGYGRENIKYLPHVKNAVKDGSFKTTAKTDQLAYYAATNTWDPAVVKTPNPYAVTVFENSPLNRVKEQGAPGAAWQPLPTAGTGHTVKTDYGTNTATGLDVVKLWTVTANGASGTTNYTAGRLYRTTVRDENTVNTTARAGSVDEYKDFEDRVVLKRVWESESRALNTYYVYDDFGDLRYVIPPADTEKGFSEVTTDTSYATFNNYIYSYKYDGRRRLVEKKIPGKGWEYLVYNTNDQVVLTQDAEQRVRKEWAYNRYDAFGRVTSSGLYTNNVKVTRADVSGLVDTVKGPLWETRTGADYPAPATTFPLAGTGITIKPLIVNYYDDYTFVGATTLPASGITKSTKIKSLQTGSKVYRTDGTAPLFTVMYYDDYGRVIQTASQNHLEGKDYVTNTYNFPGELLTSTRVHTPKTGAATTIVTTNSYDHVGRLIATKEKIGAQAEVTLVSNSYNEIGQLKSKAVGKAGTETSFVNTSTYTYNERGWLSKSTSPKFSQQLKYQDGTGPQWNGNISQQLWGDDATLPNTFSYQYDKLNRLLSGTNGQTGTASIAEVMSYDNMGNIKTLKRDALTATTYTYTGNKLTGLSGGLSGSYTYDANGNVKTDRMGMTLTYNYLNLPETAKKTGVDVAYLYDAAGTKLQKVSKIGTTSVITTIRDYVGGIEYNNGAIDIIHNAVGYAQKNGTGYVYHYNLTDHLGNVRASLKRGSSATAVDLVQRDNYYPFGKRKVVLGGNNKYLYNGKEIQGELGDQYDYGARFYDAEIGRWNVVDPLAEKFGNFSPYNYGVNNPVLMVDPTGMAAEYNWETGKYIDNGREVDFADAMASHGMNADGSSMDPPNEYKYNYESGQYDFVSAEGGNQYDIMHYENASFTINNYAGGERIGPGAWLPKRELASGALEDANWIIDVGVGVGSVSLKLLGNLVAKEGAAWLQGGKTFAQYKAARGGTQTLAKISTSTGTQRISSEFHHAFITQRMQRAYSLPNWLVNNRINVWKLNTVQHSLIDSFRYNFLRAEFKTQVGWFGKYNWFTKF